MISIFKLIFSNIPLVGVKVGVAVGIDVGVIVGMLVGANENK